MSFSVGVFPSSLKQGRVAPLLKKPGSDQSDMTNYRPITNLSTMSKILEKLAIRRLTPHVMSTGNFNEFQSAYRAGHSTETALLKIVNDIVTSACNQLTTVKWRATNLRNWLIDWLIDCWNTVYVHWSVGKLTAFCVTQKIWVSRKFAVIKLIIFS